MTAFEIVRDLVLLALGLFGTVLSVINWLEARKRDQRQVSVTFSTAIPTYIDGSLGGSYVKVEATNVGHRDVTISRIGIELSGGATIAMLGNGDFPVADTLLPLTLSDGQSASRHLPYNGIGQALRDRGGDDEVSIIPFAEDSSGAMHRGTPWKVKPAEWAQMD